MIEPIGFDETDDEYVARLEAQIARLIVGPAATPARDVTEAMALAGARSIGNTIHTDNHGVRARECWRAMWDARDGIVEPIPQGTLVSRPQRAPTASSPADSAPSQRPPE